MARFRTTWRRWVPAVSAVCVLLVGWELGSVGLSPIILPGPLDVVAAWLGLLGRVGFWADLAGTAGRSLLCFGLGLALALPLGLAMGARPAVAAFFGVWINGLRALPVVSVILLFIFWSVADTLPVWVGLLTVLPALVPTIVEGYRAQDSALVEVARVFQWPAATRFTWLTLPSLTPFLLAGGRSALGLAWKVVATAEYLALPRHGLGSALATQKTWLHMDQVFALTLSLLILSALADAVLHGLSLWYRWRLARSPETTEAPAPDAPLGRAPQPSSEPQRVVAPAPGQPDTVVGRSPLTRPGPIGSALRIAGLTFSWLPTEPAVLSNINLEILAGELVVLYGPSGCGKTTLLRLIAGLQDRSPVAEATSDWPPAQDLSLAFQEPRLLPWATVERNLRLAALAGGGRLATALSLVELDPQLRHRLPGTLSGGMRQRLNLARALVRPARLYLMDEALAGVDAERRRRILIRLREWLAAQGAACLWVSHETSDAALLGARLVRLGSA